MGIKGVLGAVGKGVLGVLTSGISDRIFDFLDSKGLSPEARSELLALREQHAFEIAKIEQEAIARELEAASAVIQAEARSESWLPRNVRPLLLLLWGVAITANIFIPVIARFWLPELKPLELQDWVYTLTAIGFSGYVVGRSSEKVLPLIFGNGRK